ncbi:MAG: PIN domain-containing protein [Paraburkholderia sp.]|uniref:type II toxin-antitoxin system VapC family toxin n=1 Tax=Paraburkholderia sp. TaxID=1926495 RepID=UPI001201F35D|nr:type II toxin-antitoxin system VapC family toxin [Paraburkholderia sp.]TAL93197.1 MAG: PIN domain-containing protein [Paraburkholderia sp.]
MIVLDTRALVAWITGQGTLSVTARAKIEHEREAGEIAISVISVLELGRYIDDGRLQLSIDKRRWLLAVASIEGLRVIPVDMAIAVRAAVFPSELASDERLIAATAITLGCELVTPEARMRELVYIETIW